MSDKAARRARLASDDEREGGGFALPSAIMAIVEPAMDAGDTGAPMDALVEGVTRALSSDARRICHIWKTPTKDVGYRALTDDLVAELVEQGYLAHTPGGLRLADTFEDKAKPREGGRLVALNLAPHGSHRARVLEREAREAHAFNEALDWRHSNALTYAAKPRIGSKDSRAKIEELAESMRRTGYDVTKPIIRDGQGRTIAGHHREAAAALAGFEPAVRVITDTAAALRAAWRDNDGRRWSKDELEKFASILAAEGKTQQEIADALHVPRKTISDHLARGARRNGQAPRPRGRPSKVDDPANRVIVKQLADEGVSVEETARRTGLGETSVTTIRRELRKAETVNGEIAISDADPEIAPQKPVEAEPPSRDGSLDADLRAAVELVRRALPEHGAWIRAELCAGP